MAVVEDQGGRCECILHSRRRHSDAPGHCSIRPAHQFGALCHASWLVFKTVDMQAGLFQHGDLNFGVAQGANLLYASGSCNTDYLNKKCFP